MPAPAMTDLARTTYREQTSTPAYQQYRAELTAVEALTSAATDLAAEHPQAAERVRALAGARQARARRAYLRSTPGALVDSRGHWAQRPYRSGPLRRPGIAHILDPVVASTTSDRRRVALCAAQLVGRDVQTGPYALRGAPPPPEWRPCTRCLSYREQLAS